jgi:hypothetical protein
VGGAAGRRFGGGGGALSTGTRIRHCTIQGQRNLFGGTLVHCFQDPLNHAHLSVQDSVVVAAALELFRRCPALGFSDCLGLEIARKSGHLPFGTFDKDLAKLEGEGAQRLRS